MRIYTDVTSLALIRIGKTSELNNQYENNFVKFGCPANWISYDLRHKNSQIGDSLECVFARVLSDYPLETIKDHFGNPMGSNLLVRQLDDGTMYLSFQPVILIPTLCFFNLTPNKIPFTHEKAPIEIDAKKLAAVYGYDCNVEDISFLIINNPLLFWNELDRVVSKAISKNISKLTAEHYHKSFSPNRYQVFIKDVEYVDFIRNGTLFNKRNDELKEIFWKSTKYRLQEEQRVIIPNIGFKQRLENLQEYDYTLNELIVELPKFKKYTKVIPFTNLSRIGIVPNSNGSFNIGYYK